MKKILTNPFAYEQLLSKEDIATHQKKKAQRVNDWQGVLARLWKLVDEQRALLVVVLLLVVTSSVLALLGPFLLGHIIDEFIVQNKWNGLLQMVGVLVIVYFFLSISLFLQNYWMIGIAQQTIYRLRTNLFAHFQKLSVTFFDKRKHGELMSRVTNDIENVSSTLNSSFIQVLSSVLTLTGTTIVMLTLSPLLTVFTLIIIPLMFIAMRWITRRTSKLFKLQQVAVGELNGLVEEAISGQRIVKAFSQEQRVINEFQEKNARLRTTGFWALTYSGYIPKVMNFLNNGSFAIVAGVGGIFALNGHVTIGTIVIFSEYARQFTRPLNDLANQWNTVLSAIAGAERVFAIMNESEEVDDAIGNHVTLKGNVTFDDVYFKYELDEAEWTIQRVSFQLEAGKTVALVGATGAGKTTIMQLLSRFYEADKGRILLDKTLISNISRESLRSQMAFVLQDPFLFEASVRENIRYGKLSATDEEIEWAAKEANAHEFIEQLPNGYETVLSADGSEISQGQKQLLSIARALIADPVILLLDEATSSIDTVTEMKIQEALERLMKGRTSFVIAHRLNTVKNADVVFVMESGQLIESGTQKQLLSQKGRFFEMMQSYDE